MMVYVARMYLMCSADPNNPEPTHTVFDQRWTPALARMWRNLAIEGNEAQFRSKLDDLIGTALMAVIRADIQLNYTFVSLEPTFQGVIWRPGQGGIHEVHHMILVRVEEQPDPIQWRIPAPDGQYGYVWAGCQWGRTNVI